MTDLEKSILATLTAKPSLYFDHAAKLSRDIFSSPNQVADVFFKRLDQNAKINSLILAEESGIEVGDWSGLISLSDLAANIDQLHGSFMKKKTRSFVDELAADLTGDQPLEECLATFDEKRDLLHQNKFAHMRPFSEIAADAVKKLQKSRASEGLTGISTGFKKLDNITGGWQQSDQVVVAARPGMGKTALAIQLAMHAARQGKRVIFFSFEMSVEQLMLRVISSDTEISSSRMRTGKITDQEMAGIEAWRADIGPLENLTIYFPKSFEDLKTQARVANHRKSIDIIFTDYMQLIDIHRKGASRNDRIGEVSRDLKLLALELQCTNILLSQLNRAVETRGGDKRPHLSDLRDSGSIEQDADMVIFPYRDSYYSENPSDCTAELLIKKHRNGPLGKIDLIWEGEFTRFTEPIKASAYTGADGRDYLPVEETPW